VLGITIDTRSGTPLYEQIIAQIHAAILTGVLAPGIDLPPVRQLAVELEINPNTVAKAYLLLERDGIIQSVRRRGCFVADEAAERLRRRTGRQVEETLDRVMAEATRLGIRGEDLLSALAQRLARPDTRGSEGDRGQHRPGTDAGDRVRHSDGTDHGR
jgi:GntR family transcriptional regulator